MGTNAQFPVVYHAAYGYHETAVLIDACLANPVLAPLVDNTNYRKLEQIPRHHPEFVAIVRKLMEDKTPKHGDFDVIMIDSPMYRIVSYDGNESVICMADLRHNAAEFLDLPKWQYAFDFSGFDQTVGFVIIKHTHPELGVIKLLLNIVPTKYYPLNQIHSYTYLINACRQLASHHDLGNVAYYVSDGIELATVPEDQGSQKVNIGERWYQAVVALPEETLYYVPE